METNLTTPNNKSSEPLVRETKNILFLAVDAQRDIIMQQARELDAYDDHEPPALVWLVIKHNRIAYRLRIVTTIEQALQAIGDHYFHFLVADDRLSEDVDGESLSAQFVRQIRYASDADHRFPKARITALVREDQNTTPTIFKLGKLNVGAYLINPNLGALLSHLDSMHESSIGKKALCLSGGGVEGFLFQLGVAKALHAHLQGASITDIEIFCGISSGSILASFLANKVDPETIEASMIGGTSMDPEDVVHSKTVFDPHYKEYLSRMWTLGKSLPGSSRGKMLSNLIRSVPIGFFRGDALHKFLCNQLDREGRTNDFRKLDRELYIGATEQDTSTHVLFGDGQWQDVPIATAVRASTALTPFFQPTKIRERYFVDGQYTRNSNFHVALKRGARLVIIINPLVPLRIDEPGYVMKKGGVFGALQALKAVIHSRFNHALQAAIEDYPEVDIVLFEPETDAMKLMSGSPMKYNIRTEIINTAFRYASNKIQREFAILEGVFARHHMRLQRQPQLKTPQLNTRE